MGKTSRGFTLIELLVVIAIIGILSSVILASLNGARKKGRDARRIADMKQVQLALEMYADANGQKYPQVSTYGGLTGLLNPTYISTVPTDPVNAGSYVYYYNSFQSSGGTTACTSGGACASYVLGAILEDETNSALAGDIDGTVGVVPCADTAGTAGYCVRP